MIETIGSLTGGIKGGQLRPVAISSERRSPLFPELPTVIESGVPGYTYTTWFGVWAPAKTPRDIVMKLNKAIGVAMAREDTKTQFANAGIEVETSTPEQFEARVKSELARWGKVIPEAGIVPQ
jgi:tripartite-type tricarboxylate transporter receptor subunit TctC